MTVNASRLFLVASAVLALLAALVAFGALSLAPAAGLGWLAVMALALAGLV